MPVKTPNWLSWLSPVFAIAGAWLVGVMMLQAGFWGILFIALVFALLPYVLYRIVHRVRVKLQNG